MNHPVGSRKRVDAMTNRARLLVEAQAVFGEVGLDLEVDGIASRAQLGVGTLYRHFGNREDLLRAIVIQTVEDALEQIRSAIQPHADDPHATLQALVMTSRQVQQQYRSLLAVLRDQQLTKLFDPAQRDAWRDQILDIADVVITRGIQASVFRENLDHDLAAATITGSLTHALGLIGRRCPPEELERRLTQFLWTIFAK
jgi:AcrR family transcriptional regulator